MDLKSEFERRGPWVTHFEINGVGLGGNFRALEDERIDQFFQSFPDVHSIMELGSLEGGHTFALARHSGIQRILGIEARASNIQRAEFVQHLLKINNATFVEADVETAKLAVFGRFDAVFCSGLLYHLPEPWKLIRQIPDVASRLFIWTHYVEEVSANLEVDGLMGREHIEAGRGEPLSGLSPTSFWLTLDSLKKALTAAGFASIRILQNEPAHRNGPAVTLAASLSGH